MFSLDHANVVPFKKESIVLKVIYVTQKAAENNLSKRHNTIYQGNARICYTDYKRIYTIL